MKPNFTEYYLIELLGSRLEREPELKAEARQGIERALGDERKEIPAVERLINALERFEVCDNTVVINLINIPFGTLWIKSLLEDAKQKLRGRKSGRIVIVGLWQVLRGKSNRRTSWTERRFNLWRSFVETNLAANNMEELRIVWLG